MKRLLLILLLLPLFIQGQEVLSLNKKVIATRYRQIPNNANQWTVKTGVFANGGTGYNSYIKCTTTGSVYKESNQVYGEWYINLYKDADANAINYYIISNDLILMADTKYRITFTNDERIALIKESVIMRSAPAYLQLQTNYQLKITRALNGDFTIYIKGGAFGNLWTLVSTVGGTGTNPINDNTITTCVYSQIGLTVNDRFANVRYLDLQRNIYNLITSDSWDVYIIGGQSNASGYEDIVNLQSDYQGDYNNTYMWTGTKIEKLNASDDNNNQYPASARLDKFGWDMAMSKTLNSNGRKVILIKYAINSTGLEEHWGSGDSLLTDSLIKYINLCKTYMQNNGYTYAIRGMLWFQGEKDMQQLSGSTNYQANLGTLITKLRANTTSNLKFYIIQPYGSLAYTYRTEVRTAMVNYVATDTYSYLFDVDDIYTTLHMNATQYEQCGIRVANKLINDLQ